MNASSVNWRNKIYDNITLKKILPFFFYEILDWKIFQANLGKFREFGFGLRPNFGLKSDPKKTLENESFLISSLF